MPRTTQQVQADTRARLLNAAATAFALQGLDGANINAISLEAGLAKGTIYNYFASKEALFLAVIEEACRLAVADSRNVTSDTSTRDRLRATVAADVRWAQENEPFARVFIRELFSGRAELYPRVVEAGAPYIEAVTAILTDGLSRGDVRSDVAVEELALVFTGVGLMALSHHWSSGGAWPSLEAIPDLVVNLFFDGVRTRSSEGAPTSDQSSEERARTDGSQR